MVKNFITKREHQFKYKEMCPFPYEDNKDHKHGDLLTLAMRKV